VSLPAWIPSPEELRKLRLRAGLSQRELARRAGVSQSLIARLEKGQVNVRLTTLQKILEALFEALQENDVAEKYMHSPVITLSPRDPVRRAVELMDRHGISQIPIVDDHGKVVGTVFETTLLKAVSVHGKEVLDRQVSEIMEDPLPQVSPKTPITIVNNMLLVYPAVLVVDRGRLVGIVTKIDVLRNVLTKPR
jgi:predicted transcriptional regulator